MMMSLKHVGFSVMKPLQKYISYIRQWTVSVHYWCSYICVCYR